MTEEILPQTETKPSPRYDVKLYQKISEKLDKKTDKKEVFIKEIGKLLTEIEESKKTKRLVYFSHLYNKKILDKDQKVIGKVIDLGISGGEKFPEVSHLLARHNGQKFVFRWSYVKSLNPMIRLNEQDEKIEKRFPKEDDIFLGEHILDKQVVDVNGLKVIRVNDLALTYIKNKMAVVSIDIGTRSIYRRLGFEKLAEWLPWEIRDHPIPWDSVEPLTSSLEKIHLKVPCPRVSDLHPADVAELFEELSLRERTTLLKSMKSETAAKILLECDVETQKTILSSFKIKRISSIMEKIPSNDAANLMSDFNNTKLDAVLKNMERNAAARIQEMLAFKVGSAARFMNESFIVVSQNITVQEALDYIRSLPNHPTHMYYVYVGDTDRLIGVLSLKNLIISNPTSTIKEVMTSKVFSVDISDPIEYVEELVRKYDLMALPVVDITGKLRGVINFEDVLDVISNKYGTREDFELTTEEKEDLKKHKRSNRYYSTFVRDIGQFLKELEKAKPKKQDYIKSSILTGKINGKN